MVLPAQLPSCRCTIVIPARNEADHIITRALRSATTLRQVIEELSNVMSAPREHWLPHVSANASPGALWHALVACETLVPCEPVPVESAIATIQALIGAPAAAYEFGNCAATKDAA